MRVFASNYDFYGVNYDFYGVNYDFIYTGHFYNV